MGKVPDQLLSRRAGLPAVLAGVVLRHLERSVVSALPMQLKPQAAGLDADDNLFGQGAQQPLAGGDRDLAVRLSRTYRWRSDTRWANPLSVGQHSLTALHFRKAMTAQPLTPTEQLRELLHDAEDALVNHDEPTPLKPRPGECEPNDHQPKARLVLRERR